MKSWREMLEKRHHDERKEKRKDLGDSSHIKCVLCWISHVSSTFPWADGCAAHDKGPSPGPSPVANYLLQCNLGHFIYSENLNHFRTPCINEYHTDHYSTLIFYQMHIQTNSYYTKFILGYLLKIFIDNYSWKIWF